MGETGGAPSRLAGCNTFSVLVEVDVSLTVTVAEGSWQVPLSVFIFLSATQNMD